MAHKCKNCGDELRGFRLDDETLAADPHPDPKDTGFRMDHSSKEMKQRCLDISRERLDRQHRLAGQMMYDPVKKMFVWVGLNWRPQDAAS